MSIWNFYFGWFQGAVYSNLLASGLCAGMVYWRGRVHLRRQHDAHEARHAETHALLRSLHEKVDAAADIQNQEGER